jgi:ABC-type amino acid transport substrate-binding protein
MLEKALKYLFDNFFDPVKNDLFVFIDKHEFTSVLLISPLVLYLLLGAAFQFKKIIKPLHIFEWSLKSAGSYAFIVVILAISYIVVEYIKREGVPAPDIVNQPHVVSELTAFLNWGSAPQRPGYAIFYAVETSRNGLFAENEKEVFRTKDTVVPITCNNCTIYWRVRVILRHERTGAIQYGPWSETRRVDHYSDTLQRIRATKVLRVLVDNSYGRDFLRYLKPKRIEDLKNGGTLLGSYHDGYEPRLAYRIADRLCAELFEQRPAIRRGPPKPGAAVPRYKCLPSRDRNFISPAAPGGASLAARSETGALIPVRIFVEFIPLPRADMYKRFASGEYDIGLSNISYVKSRRAEYGISFSKNYYYETRHAALFHDASARGSAPQGCRTHVSSDFIKEKIAASGKIIAVEDSTSDICLNRLLYAAPRGTAPFSIVHSPLSSEGVDLVAGSDAAGILITDESFAESIVKYRSARIRASGGGLACAVLPYDFFGAGTMDFCHKQRYHAVMRPNQAAFKKVVDSVFRPLTNGGWKRTKPLEQKRFKAHLERRGVK